MTVIDFFTRKPIDNPAMPEKSHMTRLFEEYAKWASAADIQSVFMLCLDTDGDFYVHVNAINIDHLLRGSMLMSELKKEIKDQTYPAYVDFDEAEDTEE